MAGRRNVLVRWLTAIVLLVGGGVPSPAATDAPLAPYFPEIGFPYAAFERLPVTEIEAEGARLQLAVAPGDMALPAEALVAWIRRSARAVATYYGRFPVSSARILIVPVPGNRVRSGTTWGYRGAATRILVGAAATETALTEDWIMVHEMIHMALPQIDRRHGWLSEGIAVYVESIARVQAGDLEEGFVWREFARAMPQGLPKAGDRGLDHTPTWGRIYWGGAIFCLIADVELRRRTGNRVGLQQALRAVLAAGNHETERSLIDVLRAGDAGTGATVLTELYGSMRDEPVSPDLDTLWRDLGITLDGHQVSFEDAAPLADVRRAIVAGIGG